MNDLTSDTISPLFAHGGRVDHNVGFLGVVPGLGVWMTRPLSSGMKETGIKHTLISISLDTNMFIDDHDLNMTIPLLLASVQRPAHIFGCLKIISQLDVNFPP